MYARKLPLQLCVCTVGLPIHMIGEWRGLVGPIKEDDRGAFGISFLYASDIIFVLYRNSKVMIIVHNY